MGHEPHIVGAHVLIDVDEDQNPRHKQAEEYVRPLRDRVFRIPILKQIHQKNDPGKEKRENKKVNIHLSETSTLRIIRDEQCKKTNAIREQKTASYRIKCADNIPPAKELGGI
jgi:hypothetical protein